MFRCLTQTVFESMPEELLLPAEARPSKRVRGQTICGLCGNSATLGNRHTCKAYYLNNVVFDMSDLPCRGVDSGKECEERCALLAQVDLAAVIVSRPAEENLGIPGAYPDQVRMPAHACIVYATRSSCPWALAPQFLVTHVLIADDGAMGRGMFALDCLRKHTQVGTYTGVLTTLDKLDAANDEGADSGAGGQSRWRDMSDVSASPCLRRGPGGLPGGTSRRRAGVHAVAAPGEPAAAGKRRVRGRPALGHAGARLGRVGRDAAARHPAPAHH